MPQSEKVIVSGDGVLQRVIDLPTRLSSVKLLICEIVILCKLKKKLSCVLYQGRVEGRLKGHEVANKDLED